MCSFDHFTGNNNHVHFSPIMEPCDLDRHGGGQDRSSDPRALLTTYLTFLEHKIGHLRGILCSTPSPKQQHDIVSAELRCIIVQLVSIADDLATSAGDDTDHAGSPPLSNSTHDDSDHYAEEATADEEEHPSVGLGSYEVVQIEKEDILAPHAHACKVCGKGFKRDANLRMHMRGHGDQYKTPAALAAKPSGPASPPPPETTRRFYYSCPYAGCKRNREHRDFQPLKNPVCVKNHYRRSHCDKSHLCRRCGVKRFSVLADLRTHEKHCGRDRWVCSCGVTFSRKEKLFAHVAVFDGHTPALPPPDADADTNNAASLVHPSGEQTPASGEELNVGSIFSDFRCSGDKARLDDGRGRLPSPTGIDFCDFEGFDLLQSVAMDF
ncbi:unnamed protein product [Alopecurus aequalis]